MGAMAADSERTLLDGVDGDDDRWACGNDTSGSLGIPTALGRRCARGPSGTAQPDKLPSVAGSMPLARLPEQLGDDSYLPGHVQLGEKLDIFVMVT